MRVLVDTNILARLALPAHALNLTTRQAIESLIEDDAELCVVPQIFYEFWVIATRPAFANGLDMSPANAAAEITKTKGVFTLLSEEPGIFGRWEDLVASHGVLGKKAHDAHIVAAMMNHGVSDILTFNVQDFVRFSVITPISP
jgi:predicted nucleic acid-binding protein